MTLAALRRGGGPPPPVAARYFAGFVGWQRGELAAGIEAGW